MADLRAPGADPAHARRGRGGQAREGRLLRPGRDLRPPQAAEHGIEIDLELRPGHAAELIVQYAAQCGADLIVVGYKGHFLEDYLLGSTADRDSHRAKCPVLIVK